ncbi:unnamed protein product [Cunninghamella blakesleeana]
MKPVYIASLFFQGLMALPLMKKPSMNTQLSNMKTFFSFGDSYTTQYLNLDTLTYPDPNELSSTNGKNWVHYFTSNNKLVNWDIAYNSAPIENSLVKQDPKVTDLNKQITELFPRYFLNNNKTWASNETLYGIWVGINDIGLLATRNDTANMNQLMAKYKDLINELYKKEARHFVLINVPPIEKSPKWSKEAPTQIKNLVTEFNEGLKALVGCLKLLEGYKSVTLIDSYSILNDVINHPSNYGIKDVENTCPDWKNPEKYNCHPINEYFWLNNLHLTSRVHEILADKITEQFLLYFTFQFFLFYTLVNGDLFFGFNTKLPSLDDDEAFRLSQKERAAREDANVYDFSTLRDELGCDDDYDDNLGDQLVEQGDDFNDETFGDDNIGQDFDFATNTLKFTENLPEEERMLHHRNKPHEAQATQQNDGLSWNNSNNNNNNMDENHVDHRLAPRPIHGDSSPSVSAAGIWGSFGNNESFAGMNHGNVSPFARHQQLGYGSPLPNMSPSNSMGVLPPQQQQRARQHLSLEEIEAELHRAKYRQAYGDDINNRKKMLSLAEVEAAMLQQGNNNNGNMGGMSGRDAALFHQLQQQQHQHQQQLLQQQQQQLLQLRQQQQQQDPNLPFNNFAQPDASHLLAMRQQQELMEQMSIERELKRREDMRKSQYDGLMTQHDKDFVQRIQLTQLASGDPYADDFYYQVYSSLRMRAAGMNNSNNNNANNKPSSNGSRNGRGRREDNMMQRMQMQIQRIVNDAKRRPKQTQVTLEGALGKITTLSTRNPRQTLQVSEKKPTSQEGDPTSPKLTD